jgi:hypothetical protein
LAADLSGLDLLVIQIDGLHVGDHVLVAAIGIDGDGDKHVVERGLQPDICRLLIIDDLSVCPRTY